MSNTQDLSDTQLGPDGRYLVVIARQGMAVFGDQGSPTFFCTG